MKYIISILMLFSVTFFAQTFSVEKIEGKVLVQRGLSENWDVVTKGDVLKLTDVIMTEEKSEIRLSSGDKTFYLHSDAALALDKIREVSLNDLLLAFAIEEIERANESREKSKVKNSSAYGAKEANKEAVSPALGQWGERRLNGAIQLAENGYQNSAILAAKEVYRVYPATQSATKKRLYFAELLYDKGLYNEAYSEISDIESKSDKSFQQEIETLKNKVVTSLGNQ